MPSIKMKTKGSSCCIGGKTCLRVCQKSNKISKKSCSYAGISKQVAELDTCIQNTLKFSSSTQVSSKDIESSESFNDINLVDEDHSDFQNLHLFPVDSSASRRMESNLARSSNLETIFSLAFEPTELHSELKAENDAVGSITDAAMPAPGADDSDVSRCLCGYETCDVSDFYVSDMIVTSLPFDGNAFNSDTRETVCLPDYDAEPNLLLDVANHYLILHALEEHVRSSDTADVKSCEEAVVIPVNDSSYSAVTQIQSCNQESDVKYDLDQPESFDPQLFIKNLPDLSDDVSNFEPVLLPKESQKRKSVTLVLDLDETLVHSTMEHCDDADFTFNVFFNMKEHTVFVKQRPYLHTFLERVAEMFEVVIFTASQSIYAEQLLNILDPDGKLISHRVYRDSCIFSDGTYTKDLTILGVDLAKVAIVDNSPQVFRLQVNNGIPIKSWFDDPSDSALISLLPFLETLADADDVRPIIAKRFGVQLSKEVIHFVQEYIFLLANIFK